LEDTFGMPEREVDRLISEKTLGQMAILLHRRGQIHSAALLLDVELMTWQTRYSPDYDPGWIGEATGTSWQEVVFDVESYLVDRFDDERLAEMKSALDTIAEHESRGNVKSLRVRESLPEVSENWREQIGEALGTGGPTNQARRIRLEPQHPIVDGLHLTNEWEHRVYAVLRAKQQELAPNDTIGIFPLSNGKVDNAGTVEPDLLVTYRGRAGVIEVDGPHHTSALRRADDQSRERRLRNAGIAHVDRIDVRDTTERAEVEQFVETFLRRLLDHR
jgi:hypothetical protein